MRRGACLLLGLLLPVIAGAAPPAVLHVYAIGAVKHAGTVAVTPGARLAQVALAAGVKPGAYPLGASWLEPSLQRAQVKLKAGLGFDLKVLKDAAALRHDRALLGLATRWRKWLESMPVTGRRTGLVLDPRRLELAHVNPIVENGAILTYPTRPTSVRVVGAVRKPCVRRFVPMQAARDYLAGCAHASGAEPDWMYVIEPDGQVTRRGIGAWNREPPIPVAPGAVLYVPLGHAALETMQDPHFNRDMARFLATQPLPEGTP